MQVCYCKRTYLVSSRECSIFHRSPPPPPRQPILRHPFIIPLRFVVSGRSLLSCLALFRHFSSRGRQSYAWRQSSRLVLQESPNAMNNHYHIIIHWNKSWLPQSHMNIGTWRLTKCLKTDGKKNKRFALCCSCMRILTERARAIQLLSIPLLYNISSSHYSPRVDNMMIIHYTWYGKTRGGCKDV